MCKRGVSGCSKQRSKNATLLPICEIGFHLDGQRQSNTEQEGEGQTGAPTKEGEGAGRFRAHARHISTGRLEQLAIHLVQFPPGQYCVV